MFRDTPRLLDELNPLPAPDYTEPTYTAFTWERAGEGIKRLLRHEGQLERSFFRTLHELERIQARRLNQIIPPIVTLDVNLSDTRE